MIKLWPPLEFVDMNLFPSKKEELPISDNEGFLEMSVLIGADADNDDSIPEMPWWLNDWCERRIAVHQSFVEAVSTDKLKPGTLIKLGSLEFPDWPLAGPLGLLLDCPVRSSSQPNQKRRWWAWVAAEETGYAGDEDVILDESDLPFDPAVGMIQLWNRIEVLLPPEIDLAGLLGRKKYDLIVEYWQRRCRSYLKGSARLDVLARLAYSLRDQARPGTVQVIDIDDKTMTVGTPVGGAADPRHLYRKLYGDAAAKVQKYFLADTRRE